jgi:MFS transporter, PPP family, 3-phenylpropionic acid transporter
VTAFRSAARLASLYGACFAVLGVSIPFFPVWLAHRGLEASAIGTILGGSILVRALFAPPLMALADRGVGVRRLLMAGNLGAALTYAGLSAVEGPFAIGLLALGLAVAQAAVVPLTDLAVTDAVRRDPRLTYGRIRLWGSITFLATNVASGALIGLVGAGVVAWLLAALSLASLGVAWIGSPEPGSEPAEAAHGAFGPPGSEPQRALWWVLAAAACIQASHAALYGFASLDWTGRGFPDAVIGVLWAIGVVAEIALFAVLGPVVKDAEGAFRCLMLGGTAAAIRFALMALEPDLPTTIALQTLHAFSFGATHLGTMAALAALSPPGLRGRVQGVVSSGIALGSAGASVASGALFRSAGSLAFAAMVPLAALGVVCAVAAARRFARQPQSAGEGG